MGTVTVREYCMRLLAEWKMSYLMNVLIIFLPFFFQVLKKQFDILGNNLIQLQQFSLEVGGDSQSSKTHTRVPLKAHPTSA